MKRALVFIVALVLLMAGCEHAAVDTPSPAVATTPPQTLPPTPSPTPTPQPTATPARLTNEQLEAAFKLFSDAVNESVVDSLTTLTDAGDSISSAIMLAGEAEQYKGQNVRGLFITATTLLNSCAQAAVVLDDVDIADADADNGYYGGLYDMYGLVITFVDKDGDMIYRGVVLVGTHEILEQ